MEDLIAIFPNPVRDNRLIIQPDIMKDLKVELLDLNGKVILFEEFVRTSSGRQQKVLNLPLLPGGVYLIRISDAGSAMIRKVVVER